MREIQFEYFMNIVNFLNRNVVSTWSSGTGGAGIIGALSYAGLTNLGLNTTQTLLVMLIVPAAEAIAFWIILRHNNQAAAEVAVTNGCDNPVTVTDSNSDFQNVQGSKQEGSQEDVEKTQVSPYDEEDTPLIGFKQKIRYVPKMFKYMIPLTLVYLFEYFINQGLVSTQLLLNSYPKIFPLFTKYIDKI